MGYERQHRGLNQSYKPSFQGGDRVTYQNIGLTAAYFPTVGRFADMGCGLGDASFYLAKLFPRALIVGVDSSPESIAYALSHHQAQNLSFLTGDLAQKIFEPASLDGIFNSSALHQVFSSHQIPTAQIGNLLDAHTLQLKEGGLLAIRDFAVPEFRGPILIELSRDDAPFAQDPQNPESWSTADLFLKFSKGFKSSLYPDGSVPWSDASETLTPSEQKQLFRAVVDFRTALEFILHKDVRATWDQELQKEYTYFTKKQFESELKQRGYQILVSTSIRDPWIIKNCFEGSIRLLHLHTKHPLPWPATSYLIVGQKCAAHKPVELVEAHFDEVVTPQSLSLECHILESTQQKIEMCHRSQRVVDLIPWFREGDDLKLLVQRGVPRPILNSMADIPSPVDDTYTAGYVVEPISVPWDHPSPQNIPQILHQRINLQKTHIIAVEPGLTTLPSAGVIDETIESFYIEIIPEAVGEIHLGESRAFPNLGVLDVVSANQLLRGYQIGGLFDNRVNIVLYDLLLRKGIPLNPWLGEQCDLSKFKSCHPLPKKIDKLFEDLGERFKKLEPYSHFEQLRSFTGTFVEKNAAKQVLRSIECEYIVPRQASRFTCSLLPIAKQANKLYVGLDKKIRPIGLPAKNSTILYGVPAWRLGPDTFTYEDALREIRQKLMNEHGVNAHQPIRLGGSYAPTPGISPERVTPFVAIVEEMFSSEAPLHWVELDEWVNHRSRFHDAHLLVSVLRAFHLFKTHGL